MFKIERLISNCMVLLFLCSCAAISHRAGISDAAIVGAAKAELMTVREGLGMCRAESEDSAYPSTSSITSYTDLRRVLSPHMKIPSERDAAWAFVFYVSARPDTFVLRGEAKDANRTLLTLTSPSTRP